MDVGGGLGALLKGLTRFLPSTSLVLFDRPLVVNLAPNIDGLERIGGDFFHPLPKVADGILLTRVLHDWPDQEAG